MTKILIAIAVVAFFAVVATFWQANHAREFMKTAGKVTGRIISKEERVADPKNKRKEYWVMYSFEVGSTNQTTQELVEYPDIWQSLRENYPADVYYNKNNPSECHLAVLLDRRLGLADKLRTR